VELNQEIRQIQTEIQGMKFADCTSEGDFKVAGEINTRKYRTTLAGVTVDREEVGNMVMTTDCRRM
jgi:hypothetical protein